MLRPLFIIWRECNDTGIALIDEQHRGIVSIINTFYYLAGMTKRDKKLYLQIIATIFDYSSIHFATEEGMLEACEYSDIENHKELHKTLLLDMERIKHDIIAENDPTLLLDFLKKWWIEHINEKDMLYAPHLLARVPITHSI